MGDDTGNVASTLGGSLRTDNAYKSNGPCWSLLVGVTTTIRKYTATELCDIQKELLSFVFKYWCYPQYRIKILNKYFSGNYYYE